MGTNIQNTSQ